MWVVHTTESGTTTRAQPKLKQVQMFAPGEDPNIIVFAIPKEEEKMMVIQCHTHLEQELFDSLSIQTSEAVLVPRVDPGSTKYLFCQLSLDLAHELVRQYGTRPRFGIMPLRWYHGHGVNNLPRRFEVYVSAEVRQKHVPFMFAYLLSIFSDLTPDGILTTQPGVAIQIVGYNKIRLGLSDEAHKTLVDQIAR